MTKKQALNYLKSSGFSKEQIQAVVEVLGQESTAKNETLVSLGSYKQVAFERDIAVEQLKELGYQLGEKVRKADDCISRAEVLKLMQDNWHTHNGDWAMQESMDDIRALPSVTPQEPTNDLGVDAVLREKAIKWAKYFFDNYDAKAANDLVMGMLRDLPSVTLQEPRWIPVSEYLPATNDEVLVTYIVNGNTKKRYVETANCFDGEWSSVNDEYRIPNTKIEIIAWCEMPKPYREVEE